MTTIAKPVDNGVKTEALLAAREALSEAPEGADFTWRASCSWVNGTYSRSTVEGFSGLDIDADASADEIEALVAQSQKRSAVFDDDPRLDGRHAGMASCCQRDLIAASSWPPANSGPRASPSIGRVTT